MPYGSFVKSFLTTSVTVTDGNSGTSAMNVPLMAAGIMPRGRAAGIQIWSVEFEFSDATWIITDNKTLAMFLSQVTVSAEKYINDRDVLIKRKLHSELTTSGTWLVEQVINCDIYPAIPFYGSQLFLGVTNNTGATQTVYVKVWYSLVTLSQNELLAQMQQQMTS